MLCGHGLELFQCLLNHRAHSEISALKSKTDLLVDVSHLHKAQIHHLEEKTDATNKLLPDLLESNVWFTTKIIDAVEKKFQSVVHHHKNVVKSAQHHRLAPGTLPHNVLDEILKFLYWWTANFLNDAPCTSESLIDFSEETTRTIIHATQDRKHFKLK